MSSNRIGGFDSAEPGKNLGARSQEQHRKVEKVEKVKAVDEAENERTKKKFQQLLKSDDETEEVREPSPYETSFYKETPSKGSLASEPDLSQGQVPSPQYSQAPHADQTPQKETSSKSPLPRSQNFWENQDPSTDHNPKKTQIEPAKKAFEKKPQQSKDFPVLKNEKSSNLKNSMSTKSNNNDKDQIPQGLISPFDLAKSSQKKTDTEKSLEEKKEEKRKESLQQSQTTARSETHKQPEKKNFEEKKKHVSQFLEIDPSLKESFPAHIAAQTQIAFVQASPYLNPAIAPLFFQMVGTIFFMKSKGIDSTEFLLNSPSFANSKFFGATITIERYSTAQNALNIRLTGPDLAVKAFQENISNLYAAFQNDNFSFRIGRIYAEYSTEKPLFSRKDKLQDKGSGDFSDQRGKG